MSGKKNNNKSVLDSTKAAIDNTVNNISEGPIAQNAKVQSDKTKAEFADLANARTVPDEPAATGQPLTHYHSMFYRLLSWKNPRATSISFAASVIFIFAARYLHILRYIFKGLYIVLFLTASAEIAGKAVLGNGLTSQFRPRKYLVIPKASLERFLDDFEQLINFFVIETQRVIFAENIYVTAAAFIAAFISYWLIKFLPLWGLSLIATTVLYLGPLIYVKNQEVIDAQLAKGRQIVNQQATQIRDLAAQHTGRASETIRTYAGEYSHKAQEIIGGARGRPASPPASSPTASSPAGVKNEDFPTAPVTEPEVVASPPRAAPTAEAL